MEIVTLKGNDLVNFQKNNNKGFTKFLLMCWFTSAIYLIPKSLWCGFQQVIYVTQAHWAID